MTSKLSDTIIKRLPAPAEGYAITWDAQVAGFGARVTAAGARSFILNYRTRLGRARRFTIGTFPNWSTGAARDEARRLKTQIDRGGDPLGEIKAGRAAPTIADLCDRFEAEYLPRKRASTARSYRQQIAAEIRPALGRRKVAEIVFADVDALHRAITKRGRPYRANRVIATLSRMMSLAIKWHMRPDNPCRGVERNQEHKRRRYLTADELVRLGKALDDYSDRQSANIIGLLLLTGARRGEVLTARWADFNAEFTTWSKPGAATKQKTEHAVPLNSAARELLVKIRRQAAAGAVWVFPANGSHRRDVKDAWASLCRTAKISGARVHDLRHTFASMLASAGHSLPMIGALLGHTAAATTSRYAHLFDESQRAASEHVAALITGKPVVVPLPDSRRG
jgi:integrase